jgi:K+-sensing histidine kinase KdpD
MVGGPEHAAKDALSDDQREMMRTISHNLRTPLAVVKGCIDMLLTHGGENIDEERREELLVTASTNVDRLADAITWLEESFGMLTRRATIRLPEEGSQSRSLEEGAERGPRVV